MVNKHTDEPSDEPDFGSPRSLLDAQDDGDWDIPSLTFPSVDETGEHKAKKVSLSFPEVDGETTVAAGHTAMPAVPLPQATATSETTVLPPVGDGPSAADARKALESEETTVLTSGGIDAVADPAQPEGTGLRGIIEGTGEHVEPHGGSSAGDVPPVPPVPPVAQPAGGAAAARRSAPSRRKLFIGIGVAAAVAVAAGVAAFGYIQRSGEQARFDTALAACKTSADDAAKANDALAAALKKAKDAQDITADQLADSSTLTKLSNAIDDVQSTDATHACSATLTTAELNAHAEQNTKLASTIAASTKSLDSAVKAVTDSQDKKAEAEAETIKQNLQQAVTDAQTLLTDSEGAVADDSTRQTLQSAVDKANSLLKEKKPKAADLQQALTDIQNATAAVNESMSARSTTTGGDNGYTSSGSGTNGYNNYDYGNSGYGNSNSYGYNNYSNNGYTYGGSSDSGTGNGTTGTGSGASQGQTGTQNGTNSGTGTGDSGTSNGSGSGSDSGTGTGTGTGSATE